jgi:hypothetical protein
MSGLRRPAFCAVRILSVSSLLALSACKKDVVAPLVATTISTSVTRLTFDALGASEDVSVTVRDQNGAVMTGVPLSFAIDISSVAGVSGRTAASVTSVGDGTAKLTVSAGTLSTVVSITVAQAPMAPVKLSGDVQGGTVGALLPSPLRVRVQDRKGAPVAGRAVIFAAASGSGVATPSTVTTSADGIATTSWTLGHNTGTQLLTASAVGVAGAASFMAIASVGTAASVLLSAGDGQSAPVGTAVAAPLAALVRDAYGNPVPNVTVTFAASTGSGSITGSPATTNPQGVATAGTWTLGTTAGPQTVTATVAGVAPRVFTATAVASSVASLVAASGDAQSALAGTTLPTALSVLAKDQFGNTVPNTVVTFAVTGGGGSVTPTTATTGANGIATGAMWKIGGKGGAQTATASTAGITVTFTATILSAFPITLRYYGATPLPAVQALFVNAVTRLRSAIVASAGTSYLNGLNLASCSVTGLSGTLNEGTAGVIIYAAVMHIDGPGGVRAESGPCVVRATNGLPVIAVVKIDDDDILTFISDGRLESVILHEMTHAVGFGTTWSDKSLVTSPAYNGAGVATGSTDPRFTGAAAAAACIAAGGVAPVCTVATGVAAEMGGGVGTADVHWRESMFGTELMSGFLEPEGTPMPWSAVTIASLQDLGYTVNLLAGDAYVVPSTMARSRMALRGEPATIQETVHRPRLRVGADGVPQFIPGPP